MKTLIRLYQKCRPFIMGIVFALFGYIAIRAINQSESLGMKIFIGVTALIVFIISAFYEYLKIKFTDLQKSLVTAKNIAQTEEKRDNLNKLDFKRGMKDSITLFDVLFTLDKNQPQQTLNVLKENEPLFKVNLDNLLIKRYSTFKAYTLLNNRTQAKAAYHELSKLKETNLNKAKRMSLLYNWQQIEALNTYFNQQDYKKAIKMYNDIDTSNMNPRELLHLNVEKREVAKHLRNQQIIDETNSVINSISDDSPFKEN